MEHYPLKWGEPEFSFFERRSERIDTSLFEIEMYNLVLEVGCGAGSLLEALSEKHPKAKFIGMDNSAVAIDHARSKYQKKNLNFMVGNASAIPFKNNTFQTVYCQTLLMYVPNPVRAVQEMGRVTKPGGKVMVLGESDWSDFSFYPPNKYMDQLVHFFLKKLPNNGDIFSTGQSLSRLFSEASLIKVKTWESPEPERFVPASVMMTDRYLEIASGILHLDTKVSFDPEHCLQEIGKWAQLSNARLVMPKSMGAIGYKKDDKI